LFKAAKELNIGIATAVDFLGKKGFAVENKPTTKLSKEMYDTLMKEFQGDKIVKEEANQIVIGKIRRDEPEVAEKAPEVPSKKQDFENEGILIKNLHSYTPPAEKPKEEKPVEAKPVEPVKVAEPVKPEEPIVAKEDDGSLPGVKIVGKIDLNNLNTKTRPDKKEEPAPIVETKKETPAVVETPKVETKVEQPKEEKPILAEEVKVPVQETKVEEKPKVEEPKPVVTATPVAETPAEDEVIKARSVKLSGPNIIGKIVLPTTPDRRNQPVASSNDSEAAKRKRKRKKTPGGPNAPQQGQGTQGAAPSQAQPGQQAPRPTGTGVPANRPDFRNNTNNTAGGRPNFRNARPGAPSGGPKEEPTEKEIQDQIKATLARLSGAGKSGKFAQRAKLRRQKRDDVALTAEEAAAEEQLQSKVLKVTEFVTANELANMMDVPVTKIIGTCMSLGMFVSINQRLDAETLTIVADEFGYEIQFVKADEEADS
ncbi:MAG: translation initiation factor IF-2, partial [Pedobacter sp.]